MSDRTSDPKMTRRGLLRAAALAVGGVAVGSLLEACAQPSQPAAPTAQPKQTGAAGAPAASTAPAVAPKGGSPLKLGILLPYSGVYAQLGQDITDAMLLYFEQQNNTVAGRRLEVVKEEEGADGQAGLQKARKLIESDKVDLVTGLVNSAIALAVRDLFHQSKKILIINNAGANDITGARKSPYIFRTSFANSQVGYAMGEWFYKNVAKEAFVAAADYAAGKEDVMGFRQAFEKAGGKVVGEAWPPFPGTDYGDYLLQIRNARPPATFHFFAGADAVKFVKQAAEFGLTREMKITCAGFMVEEDVLPAQGDAALGIISSLHYAMLVDNPLNKQFVDAYTKKYNRDTNVYAMQGYDTAKVIAEALTKTDGDTSNPDKLAEALRTTKWDSPRGPMEFDETQNVVQNFYIREVKTVNGKPHNVVLDTVPKVAWPPK